MTYTKMRIVRPQGPVSIYFNGELVALRLEDGTILPFYGPSKMEWLEATNQLRG